MYDVLHTPCPEWGCRGFQKRPGIIMTGDTGTVHQISKIIRPAITVEDVHAPGIKYAQGALQKMDLERAKELFEHWDFIPETIQNNRALFDYSQCRVYQFQSTSAQGLSVIGTVITDGSHNLVDYAVPMHFSNRCRALLIPLIRAMCTPASVNYRIRQH